MRALLGRRSRRLVIITAAVFAIAGGIAYATIPNAAGVYTACKLNTLGTIRLIDPSLPTTSLLQHCNTTLETQITWNQQGVPGAAGTNGTNGKDGVNGLPGTNGTNGAPCLPSIPACVGPTGPAGAAGKDGTNGTNGKDGVDGLPGTNGTDGAPCLPSIPACVGPTGPAGAAGKDGTDGTNGTNGVDGLDGTNGTNGVSVTSAVEPTGANCANGGSSFTSVSGTTYACNGADGTGGGPTGQNAVTAYGTGFLPVTNFTFADVPGLSTTVNVPANSVLYISTDGGVLMASPAAVASASAVVDIQLLIDGSFVAHGGFRRVFVLDNAAVWSNPVENWSMALTAPLTPGNHTIRVQARLVGSFSSPGGALVSGGDGTITQGTLNVVTIAK